MNIPNHTGLYKNKKNELLIYYVYLGMVVAYRLILATERSMAIRPISLFIISTDI